MALNAKVVIHKRTQDTAEVRPDLHTFRVLTIPLFLLFPKPIMSKFSEPLFMKSFGNVWELIREERQRGTCLRITGYSLTSSSRRYWLCDSQLHLSVSGRPFRIQTREPDILISDPSSATYESYKLPKSFPFPPLWFLSQGTESWSQFCLSLA